MVRDKVKEAEWKYLDIKEHCQQMPTLTLKLTLT